MPYRVEWEDRAKRDFRNLPSSHMIMVRKMIGSFPHDRWLKGRPFRRAELAIPNLMMFDVGGLSLVYRLNEAEQKVSIFRILGSDE